ncbi:uncharacterized protein [Aristolochia californica]|uniref:uncharacterized protein n=1 Tax=Aristolochia californica TaxID=171875 RepID=UPI0035DC5F6D
MEENFESLIDGWWDEGPSFGRREWAFPLKLRFIKGKIKEWANSRHTSLIVEKASLTSQIAALDVVEEQRYLTSDEFSLRVSLNFKLSTILHQEKVRWKQRARFKWLKEGDANTKFFHAVASAKRRSNRITSLCINNEVTSCWISITNELVKFFTELYSEECTSRPKLTHICFSRISPAAVALIESPFSSAEIERAVLGMESDRVPGPDGFNGDFLKKF